ncbi:MAG: cytochrome c family protein [Hyphomicrobiaceae bacterium]|nr:cytochrome c family protein [Hyphomicrobiaceae bacterium]
MHVRALIGLALLISAGSPAAADPENGEKVFRKCRACHQVGEGAKNAVGPLLNGIVGRPAGSIDGFNYSQANREAGKEGLVWTEDKLLEYLKDPRAFMPKNKMAFAGLKDEEDRKDVIAYLKKFSR